MNGMGMGGNIMNGIGDNMMSVMAMGGNMID